MSNRDNSLHVPCLLRSDRMKLIPCSLAEGTRFTLRANRNIEQQYKWYRVQKAFYKQRKAWETKSLEIKLLY